MDSVYYHRLEHYRNGAGGHQTGRYLALREYFRLSVVHIGSYYVSRYGKVFDVSIWHLLLDNLQ